jgi:hypothetical protein
VVGLDRAALGRLDGGTTITPMTEPVLIIEYSRACCSDF